MVLECCVRHNKGGQVRPRKALVYNLRSRCLAAQMVAPEFILTLRIMSDSDWYPIGTVPAREALGTSSRGTPAPYLVTQRVWFSVRIRRLRGGRHIVGLGQGHDQPERFARPKVLLALSRSPHTEMHGHDIGQLLWPLGTHIMLEWMCRINVCCPSPVASTRVT